MKTFLLVLLLGSAAAQAADTVNITVRGNLTRPPCVLSTGTTLTANFGDVRTDQVDTRGTVDVPVRMNCPAGSSMNVSFSANSGTFTSTVAKTTVSNLGVSLLWADNSAANLQGTAKGYSNLSGAVDISLKAKLVKRGDLTPGGFSSGLVMTINYL
ncbi:MULTISPECIES: fimbrial protein [unclassified Pseudomonas]|uniref:fimbrial protein n=1 Tax=unclassified Pseudomonas TaxID=196821 RepID=UPI000BDD2334|nr:MULTISPECIES: fimbrial protein [unclassified Pseudomonas]PVZ12667.1 type 1 fimbria pilin [Pseudomonas sp. URIL14HWK12:I12]PVZ23182.1 type 1 fimbria pilin [Pseudomonas sp. URIL14HWK12:I10]PVZ32511.1 type 1 fimbria pilin [Pseudomonas sp. URIL14HWK12:I11]SNZ13570.1 Fimbrial protein [Pseudomonas sp. URIL14HWK12:I9]